LSWRNWPALLLLRSRGTFLLASARTLHGRSGLQFFLTLDDARDLMLAFLIVVLFAGGAPRHASHCT
jgi:hypothetical protein